jgi:hypothetical protein
MTVDDAISRALTSTPTPVPPPLERIGRRARTLRRRRRAGQAAGGVAVLAGVVAVALPFLPGDPARGPGEFASVPVATGPAASAPETPVEVPVPELIEVHRDELRDRAGMDAVIARLRDYGIAAVRQDPACSYRPELLGPDSVGAAVDLTRDADTALAIEPALIPDGVTLLIALSGPTVRTTGPDAGGVGFGVGVNAIPTLPDGALPLCITDPLPW